MKRLIAIFIVFGCLFYSLGYESNHEASNEEIMGAINVGASESYYTKEVN